MKMKKLASHLKICYIIISKRDEQGTDWVEYMWCNYSKCILFSLQKAGILKEEW